MFSVNVMFLLKLYKADSYCLFSKGDSIIPTDNVPSSYQTVLRSVIQFTEIRMLFLNISFFFEDKEEEGTAI